VVFSVTIVALSLAADAYSPRVLRTFMHDRPTQVAFGVFVGIFAYCLVVLRTVRGSDSDAQPFVPSLAVFGALVLALLGVWVLVYFIHHVAVAIQVSSILARIARETRRAIERLFPEDLGEDEDDSAEEPMPLELGWRTLPARRSGYIVSVDAEGLLAFARSRGVVVRMERAVGDFAIESQPLASLAGGTADVGVQQIVDVATRALSPGINNPSTAQMCIDHLSALLVRLAQRRIPSRLRREGKELRVIACGPTFESLTALVFEPLRRYAQRNPEVLESLERAARAVESAASPRRRAVMARHVDAIAAQRHT
jgi:uncharacterized membrane protein